MRPTRPLFKKHPFKSNGFCFVVHNLRPDVKPIFESFIETDFNQVRRSIVSLEPTPNKEEHHAHVFVEAIGKHRWNSTKVSSWWKKNYFNIVKELDTYPDGEYGRLQLEPLHDWDAAVRYLTEPEKDKEIDPSARPIDHEYERKMKDWEWSFNVMNSMYVSSFTGEWTSGRKILKELEQRKVEPGVWWRTVQRVWELGPPNPPNFDD